MLFEEIKDNFFAALNAGDGMDCPCCGRYAQVYKRRITSTMAAQLVELHRAGGAGAFVHIKAVVGNRSGAGDFTKLKYWGIIRQAEHDDPARRDSGLWTITERGLYFMRGMLHLPEYFLVFDDKIIGRSETQVSFEQCFGQHFNYERLMEGV